MTRCLALLALVAILAAGDDVLAATPLRWAAGPATLAEAVARLHADGNRVLLADGLDGQAPADLPALDGVWWDGVAAICAAWKLRPDPGEPAPARRNRASSAQVPVGHGTLLLLPGPTPGLQVHDGLLAIATADATRVTLALRAEPRVPRGSIAWGQIASATLEPGGDDRLGEAEPDSAVLAWQLLRTVPPGARLAVAAEVAPSQAWQRETELTAGKDVAITIGEQTLTAALLTDAGQTEWQGEPIGERRPLLAVAGPAALLEGLRVELTADGAEVGSRGGGQRRNNERASLYRYLRAVPEGRLVLTLAGRSDGPSRPLAIAVPLPPPVRADRPTEAPTPFACAAGTAPLSRWLQALSASGNPVLAEVGLDVSLAVTMPAVDGAWWDGVLALCRAAGLAPAPPTTGPIGDGALRLVKRPLPAVAACGPVLVLATREESPAGLVVLRLHLLTEPRLPAGTFTAPQANWATWAMDEMQTPHPLAVEEQSQRAAMIVHIGNGRFMESVQGAAAGGLRASVRLVRPEAQRLELSGLLSLGRRREFNGATVLAAGGTAELALGDRVVELTALAAPTRIDGQTFPAGVLARGLHGFDNLRHSIAPLGAEGAGDSSTTSGQRFDSQPRLLHGPVPAQGEVEVRLAVATETAPLVLPLRLVVPVADGH